MVSCFHVGDSFVEVRGGLNGQLCCIQGGCGRGLFPVDWVRINKITQAAANFCFVFSQIYFSCDNHWVIASMMVKNV